MDPVHSRAISMAMDPFLGKFAVAYIDDITVYSKDLPSHFDHLRQVFERLGAVNMKLNSLICDLVKDSITFLGFVISSDGIKPMESRIEKIKSFPRHMNATAVRAFLGLAGFYRRHVQLFSEISAPLSALTSKSKPFIWTDIEERSFNQLKEALANCAILAFPDPNLTYSVYTDPSEIGIGAVLTQKTNEDERPICFLSRKLQPAVMRYPTV